MKLVVGLGNPGRKYQQTRHNIGFMALDELAMRQGSDRRGSDRRGANQPGAARRKSDFQAEVLEIGLAGDKCLLVWPQTYMNLSGSSVLAARDFYKLDNADLLVICDDLNLPLGKLRIRASGSAGGQKGLDDILRRLGTQDVPRLRIGVGAPPPQRDAVDWVLGKFTADEQVEVAIALGRAVDAIEAWAAEGIAVAMNRFNAAP
jgi:PTH1 family peptidyl-tRNA hydrolase